jgi:hypothetical protein
MLDPSLITLTYSRKDVAAYLLEMGADPEAMVTNETGPQSCLQFAITSKNTELAPLFFGKPWVQYVMCYCSYRSLR